MIHTWVRYTHKLNCFIFSSKQSEDSHIKLGSSRHKQYNTVNRPPTPRTPKHRLSVDPNLQIPEILNSASKKDLLRRVCHKWAYGESRSDMSPLVYINERKMLHFFFLIADFTIIKIILFFKWLKSIKHHRKVQSWNNFICIEQNLFPLFYFFSMLLNIIKF